MLCTLNVVIITVEVILDVNKAFLGVLRKHIILEGLNIVVLSNKILSEFHKVMQRLALL